VLLLENETRGEEHKESCAAKGTETPRWQPTELAYLVVRKRLTNALVREKAAGKRNSQEEKPVVSSLLRIVRR